MPKRIPFHIVYATSEDPSYPACELNSQGPGARGWRSAPSSKPPHELLLRLNCVATLHRLQLLAHHQLVPVSVEVLVSGGLVSEDAVTPCGAAYNAVGRVSLAAPEPEAMSRELRSAALSEPTTARFVKLRLSAPHPPAREDDQVALMAVNVIGDEVEQPEPNSTTAPTKELTFSPYDDLAFVMYVDNDIADIVRSLDRRKQAAVTEERFEYARRLKSASTALVAAGSRIGRWRLRKRIAAAKDDFEQARQMRDRITDALIGIQEDKMLCRLLEEDGIDPCNDVSMQQEYDFSHYLSPSVVSGCISLDIPSPVPPDPDRLRNTDTADINDRVNEWSQKDTERHNNTDSQALRTDYDMRLNAWSQKYTERHYNTDNQALDRTDCDKISSLRDTNHHQKTANLDRTDFVRVNNWSNQDTNGKECDVGIEKKFEERDHCDKVEDAVMRNGDVVDKDETPIRAIQEIYKDAYLSEAQEIQEFELKQQAIEEKIEAQKRTEQKMLEEHRILEELREEQRLELIKREQSKVDDSRNEILRNKERVEELRKEEIRRVEDKIEDCLRDEQRKEDIKRETDSPRRSITPNAANGTLVRRRNKSAGPAPRSTFEAHEESILPALRHSHTNEYLRGAREEDASVGSTSSVQKPPHKLNEREKKHASLPILIFGYPLVEKFYSKNFIDKEEGLARLRAELTSSSNGNAKTSPNKTARAAALLIQRALRDKVYSVYSQANEAVKVLFLQFVPDRVCAAEVQRCLEKLLPELLRACGDPAPRVHSTAQHTVLTVADCPMVRSLHYIPQQLVRAVPASMHPRMALSRMQMLEQLVMSHGISTDKNSGLTVRRLAECGAAGFQHAAGSVRAAAERILLLAYERSPRIVRTQLPPDDAVTRRNLIYRHLFQQFDRIDMQKILNQAPAEQDCDQSEHSILETTSISQSTRSAGMTSSLMTSIAATSSYSLKSMASSASGATLAPSSLGSLTSSATKSKSSLKKSPTKKYSPSLKSRDFSSSLGYNKLRLDSAVSPKHTPRSGSAVEKVHFEEPPPGVVYRRRNNNHNPEHRHSMIHYDHDTSKPSLKERPTTVYEPLHIDYRDSPSFGSPKTSKNDLRDVESPRHYRDFSISSKSSQDFHFKAKNDDIGSPRIYGDRTSFSPKISQNDLRDSPMEFPRRRSLDRADRGLNSPKVREYRDGNLESPKLVAGVRNLQLNIDEGCQMDESGYYSPGRRQPLPSNENQLFESYEAAGGGTEASCDSTPEPCLTTCSWCGRRVRSDALENHYWRRCVILARCPHCRLALEARSLHAHLLEDCSMSEGSWKQCHKCGAALRIDDKAYHNCIPLSMDEWKCPYCLTNVLARDLPWQRHLLQCSRNPRLTPV